MRDLLPFHRRFVAEYLSDPERIQYKAYQRVYGDHIPLAHACARAGKILARPEVKAAIETGEQAILGKLELTATDVLRVIFNVVGSDANELSEWVVGCCRYCHGDGFQYQRRPQEFRDALAEYMAKPFTRRDDPYAMKFDMQGGVGYDVRRPPRDDCPECNGEGVGRQVIKDTRNLSEAARMLYNGVRQGKHGVEIMTLSKDKAIELAAKHTGVAKENIKMDANVNAGVTFYIPSNGRDEPPQT